MIEALPDPETATSRKVSNWKKENHEVRPQIVLNLAEELVTLVASLLIFDALTKEVWDQLCNTYQRENFQSQLNVRTKLHKLRLTEVQDIQEYLTALEETFADIARINVPVVVNEKIGILLRSLPNSLSFI